MKQALRPLPCLVAIACCAWTPAHADDIAMATVTVRDRKIDVDAYEAPDATSATKISVPLRDVPQTVNVVPAVVLHDQNALSLQDALQNVPGLSFSVGDGQRDQVTIRGFSAISDQFVDGVRDDALYFRDLSNIERVEVLKGPASVLYGRGSAGGLVNRITKKPLADPPIEAGVTLGSRGQRRGEFDVGTTAADKDALFRLTGAVEDSTSFRDRYFLRRRALAPSATALSSCARAAFSRPTSVSSAASARRPARPGSPPPRSARARARWAVIEARAGRASPATLSVARSAKAASSRAALS